MRKQSNQKKRWNINLGKFSEIIKIIKSVSEVTLKKNIGEKNEKQDMEKENNF